jgi:hypothetical protein
MNSAAPRATLSKNDNVDDAEQKKSNGIHWEALESSAKGDNINVAHGFH